MDALDPLSSSTPFHEPITVRQEPLKAPEPTREAEDIEEEIEEEFIRETQEFSEPTADGSHSEEKINQVDLLA